MDAYITRQQIRAINKKLFAYDLIYNGDNNDNTVNYLITNIMLSDDATESMAGVPMLIEVGSESIKENLDNIMLIAKDSIIIQINNLMLSKMECMNEIISLKSKGYKFTVIINDTDKDLSKAKIIADIMKFDINNIPQIIIDKREELKCQFLAYNVNEKENFVAAEDFRVDYYEGTYIAMAATVNIEDNSHSEVNFLEVMSLICKDEPNIGEISNVIRRDALLASQIVKLANSAYFAGRSKTEDVRSAVIRVGLNNLKRWIFIIQFSSNSDVPEDLLKCSYLRALLAEQLANKAKNIDIKADSAYMIGLFSTLNTLTGRTMESAVSSMKLEESVEEALIYREGVGGQLLNLITAYEEANWNRVDKYITTFGLNKEELFKLYFKGLEEVENLWSNMNKLGGVA